MVSEVSAWSLQKSSKLINLDGMEHGNIWFEFDFKMWPHYPPFNKHSPLWIFTKGLEKASLPSCPLWNRLHPRESRPPPIPASLAASPEFSSHKASTTSSERKFETFWWYLATSQKSKLLPTGSNGDKLPTSTGAEFQPSTVVIGLEASKFREIFTINFGCNPFLLGYAGYLDS